jgi:hypothetical protein
MFPSPTAEPTQAIINPKFELKFPFLCGESGDVFIADKILSFYV